jgi:hypothetical protein
MRYLYYLNRNTWIKKFKLLDLMSRKLVNMLKVVKKDSLGLSVSIIETTQLFSIFHLFLAK